MPLRGVHSDRWGGVHCILHCGRLAECVTLGGTPTTLPLCVVSLSSVPSESPAGVAAATALSMIGVYEAPASEDLTDLFQGGLETQLEHRV